MSLVKQSLPSIYDSTDIKYRRNVQAFNFNERAKKFTSRKIDTKISDKKMSDIELDDILSRLESNAVHRGCLYKTISGVSIAIVCGVLSMVGMAVLGLIYWRTRYYENWVVVVVMLTPMVLALVVYLLVCGPKMRTRDERLQKTYNGIECDLDELNRGYWERQIIFNFIRSKNVLEIDFQTNDPMKKLNERSKLSISNASLTTLVSPIIPMREYSPPRPVPVPTQNNVLASVPIYEPEQSFNKDESIQVITYGNYDISMYSKYKSFSELY